MHSVFNLIARFSISTPIFQSAHGRCHRQVFYVCAYWRSLTCISAYLNNLITIVAGADPGFFPGGGGSGGKMCHITLHRHVGGRNGGGGIWSTLWAIMSIPEQTSGTLDIFSRAILFGTLLQICENIVFRDYELLGDRPGLENIAISFCHFILFNFIKLWYVLYCDWLFWRRGVLPKDFFWNVSVFTTVLIIFRR